MLRIVCCMLDCYSMRKQNGNVFCTMHIDSIKQDTSYVLNVIFCSFFMLFDPDKPKMTRDCETHYGKRKVAAYDATRSSERANERLKKSENKGIDHKHQSCFIRFCVVMLHWTATISIAVILTNCTSIHCAPCMRNARHTRLSFIARRRLRCAPNAWPKHCNMKHSTYLLIFSSFDLIQITVFFFFLSFFSYCWVFLHMQVCGLKLLSLSWEKNTTTNAFHTSSALHFASIALRAVYIIFNLQSIWYHNKLSAQRKTK